MAVAIALAAQAAAHAADLRLDGPLTQGGMIIGHTEPGARVTLDGEAVRVAPDGRFVFGFGRDAPPAAVLEVTLPDGTPERRDIAVEQRHYDIQRVEGLPPETVTPPPEVTARIARERAMVAAARKDSGDAMFWAAPLAWPAPGRISGVYGSQRILNGEPKQPHYGVDVAGPEGTPVTAPAGGTVTLAEPDFYFEGGIVIIDHGYGVSSTLMHLRTVDVHAGDSVRQGQQVATRGATGRASGPHVDWRMNWNGVRLDPQLLVAPLPAN